MTDDWNMEPLVGQVRGAKGMVSFPLEILHYIYKNFILNIHKDYKLPHSVKAFDHWCFIFTEVKHTALVVNHYHVPLENANIHATYPPMISNNLGQIEHGTSKISITTITSALSFLIGSNIFEYTSGETRTFKAIL